MARKMFKAAKNSFTPLDDLLVKFPSLVMSSILFFSDQKIEVAVKITVSWKKDLSVTLACSLMSD